MTGVRAPTRLGAADVRAAAGRVRGLVRPTPLLPLPGVRGLLLKAEHLQRGGSFKARGAANAVLAWPGRALVAGSSGNHGIALAGLGRALGVPVTIVMAAGSSSAKAAVLTGLGARVVTVAGGVAERDRHAAELAGRLGAAVVPSSDHELVVAGAGTVGLEVLDAAPGTDVIFVPTGGGGLLAGTCLAADTAVRPLRVVGVEPADGRRYASSLAAGRPVELPPPDTIADGLRAQRPGTVPLPIIRRRVDELIGVTDEAIDRALALLRAARVAAEPSGAVALAGALQAGFTGRAVAVVSGGNTPAALATPPTGRAGAVPAEIATPEEAP